MARITREEKKQYKLLEKKLGYTFKKRELLKCALMHKSYANENKLPALNHNERFEFLGDAVLELVISHLLMEKFPKASEGKLSKVRASIVNEKTLAKVAMSLNLGDFLYLGKGEDVGGGRNKSSLLSDALEAVFGAIYLDRGFKKSYKVLEKIAQKLFEQMEDEDFYKDYKTQLQETAQLLFKTVPRYRLVSEIGPDHDKQFEIHILLHNEIYGSGMGRSKKDAEQNAARMALEKIGLEGKPVS